jgi:ubiquinol-cytochrome c reductase iron-sulfur subunit
MRRRRAENVVLVLLAATALAAGGFIFFYVAYPDTQLLGLTFGLALAFPAAAAIVAGKWVVPQETAVEERTVHEEPEVAEESDRIVRDAGEGVSRRRLLIGAAGAAGATVGAAALFPAASFGPAVGDTIYRTAWRPGRIVVDEQDRPITAEDVTEKSFLTGFPEGASKEELGSSIIIVRVDPAKLELPPDRAGGAPEGILAYSKICPHAGCAVSMLQAPLYEPVEPPTALVCPCHYSTFDPAQGGKLLFGPAGRDLPQLPLEIATDRTLTAGGDFYDPIGPSYGGIRLE